MGKRGSKGKSTQDIDSRIIRKNAKIIKTMVKKIIDAECILCTLEPTT